MKEKFNKLIEHVLSNLDKNNFKFYIQVQSTEDDDTIRLIDLQYTSIKDLIVKIREFIYKYIAVYTFKNDDNKILLINNDEEISINFIVEKEDRYYRITNNFEKVLVDYLEFYSEMFVSVISKDYDKLKDIISSEDYHYIDKKYIILWGISEKDQELLKQLVPLVDDLVIEKVTDVFDMSILEFYDNELHRLLSKRLETREFAKNN